MVRLVDEPALRVAELDAGSLDDVRVETTPTDTPVGANGNNVDLRKESMAAMQSVFQYQIVTRSVNDRLSNMRTAAGAF